jgi:hypothetical protein
MKALEILRAPSRTRDGDVSMQALSRTGIALGALLSLGLFGCNADVEQCSPVTGLYEPLYTFVSGTCPAAIQATNQVNFDSGRHGVQQSIQMLPNMVVTTDIILKGCSLHMTQQIAAPPPQSSLQTKIDGQTIEISNEDELHGLVTVTQYNPDTSVACEGTYNGMFRKHVQAGSGVPGFAGSGN